MYDCNLYTVISKFFNNKELLISFVSRIIICSDKHPPMLFCKVGHPNTILKVFNMEYAKRIFYFNNRGDNNYKGVCEIIFVFAAIFHRLLNPIWVVFLLWLLEHPLHVATNNTHYMNNTFSSVFFTPTYSYNWYSMTYHR